MTGDFPPNPLEKPGYILEFQDEFEDGNLNLDKWIPYYLPQWSSREQFTCLIWTVERFKPDSNARTYSGL